MAYSGRDMILSLGPVAYWPLDDAALPMRDVGPNGLGSVATYSTLNSFQSGAFPILYTQGLGCAVIKISGYTKVCFPASSVYDFEWTHPFSVLCWSANINWNVTTTSGPVVSKEASLNVPGWRFGKVLSTARNWELRLVQSGTLFLAATAIGPASAALFNMIATYDGSGTSAGISLYQDFLPQTPTYSGGPFSSGTIKSAEGVAVGGYNTSNGTGNFDGPVGEVAIFDRCLSSAEVASLQNFSPSYGAQASNGLQHVIRSASRQAKNLRNLTGAGVKKRKRRKINPGVN